MAGKCPEVTWQKVYIVCYKERINSGKRQIYVMRLCIEMQLAQFLHVYFDYKAFNFVLHFEFARSNYKTLTLLTFSCVYYGTVFTVYIVFILQAISRFEVVVN